MNENISMGWVLSLSNPVFGNFLFWSGLLCIKLLLMSVLTGVQRYRFKVFSSEEDAKFQKAPEDSVEKPEPHVERARRAHMNDLENILPYFFIGLMYVATDPNAIAATVLFRIATIARIGHTLVYAFYPVPQPARVICFFTHLMITFYFAFSVLVAGAKYI